MPVYKCLELRKTFPKQLNVMNLLSMDSNAVNFGPYELHNENYSW